jgi:hypothetical protein
MGASMGKKFDIVGNVLTTDKGIFLLEKAIAFRRREEAWSDFEVRGGLLLVLGLLLVIWGLVAIPVFSIQTHFAPLPAEEAAYGWFQILAMLGGAAVCFASGVFLVLKPKSYYCYRIVMDVPVESRETVIFEVEGKPESRHQSEQECDAAWLKLQGWLRATK